MTQSPAWRSLDVYERALYVEFKARFTGANNGDISFSGKEMAEALNCSNVPADRACKRLVALGFVKLAKKGHFDWKARAENRTRASTWILTEYSLDYPERSAMPATKEFMRWRAETIPASPIKKKTRGDEITPVGRPGHPTPEAMGLSDHPSRVTPSPDKAQNSNMNGVTTSPAYTSTTEGANEGALDRSVGAQQYGGAGRARV
ncbi:MULTISPECIES: hypothetical protein [unclassified Mesorhizobium]|uniref:hypothetical protein n=1 Tax=unclassified Mesorhizobium TaxID=325217 RepID=UPI0012ECB028|nr:MULTISPECIES: hypothetical protein [unclassified Mesorhizobium]WJI80835.1 Bro-N domain-containing protein [Mesorhizobium sp. C374B]WJI87374.1 Bro-N domain-containing protein [Mesorhizobium sp. C372A]